MFFPKNRQQFIITFLVLSIGFSSCSNPESKSKLAVYGTVLENVMRTDTGAFRGFNLGDQLDSVQTKETGKPVKTDAELYYEYKLDSANSFNVRYTFDETGLSEVHSDIFINNPDHTDEIFNHFKTYFDQHYGASESHKGFTVWTIRSEKYDVVRINLSDESSDFTVDKAPGKISLWIYPDKE